MSRSAIIPGVIAVMLLALAGCGQKGPLYLPGDEAAAQDYDPQGAYDQNARTEDDTTPAAGNEPTQSADDDRAGAQSSPAPAASQPNAEELP